MNGSGSSAPAWLFSFVDLAFLLLIAMTQIGGTDAPELGEIIVPRIHGETAQDLSPGAAQVWQLRIHPPDVEAAGPFELIPGNDARGERLDSEALAVALASLRDDGADKPLLAPHEDSRSRDLLDAVDRIEEFWPNRRRATVAPVLAQQ
ncbi:MAG: hypothetical protein MJE66_04180 [Proteobacteria bacterium]|nr:hypothetical protein [Pseudomonadota bacterium]